MHLSKSFYVGQWKVEPNLNQISCDETQIQLVPKVMALLLVLVESHGTPLSQDRLIELVWPGQVVTDSSVYQAIAQLRKALGDSGTKKTFIERVSGKGYRLIAPIKEDDAILMPSKKMPSKKMTVKSRPFIFGCVLITILLVWGLSGFLKSTSSGLTIDGISSITLVDLQSESTGQFSQLDALTHVLLTQLTHIQGMKVVHHQTESQSVNTDVLMSGKINHEGDKVRVYLQMQRVQSAQVIWAKMFEGTIDNLFSLQDNIVADLLGLFKRQQSTQTFGGQVLSQRSFDQYLLAHHLWAQRQLPQLQQAQTIFETMQKEQQLFPLAAVGLCNTYHFLHIYGDWTLNQALAKCQPLLDEALLAQPDLGQALAAKAMLLNSQGQQIEAQSLFETAIKLAPNYAFGYMWYGNLSRDLGNYDQALAMTQKAYQLSPVSPIINRSLAYSHLNLSQMSDAKYYFQRALALEPNYSHRPVAELEFAPLNVARANAFIRWAKKYPKQMERRPYYRLTLAQIQLALGHVDVVDSQLAHFDDEKVNPAFMLYMKASAQAVKGDMTRVLALLKQRLSIDKNITRFAMPYISALTMHQDYEQAYQIFTQIRPSWSVTPPKINGDNQYLVAFYIQLQHYRNQQATVAQLTHQLTDWFNASTPQPNQYLAHWLVFRGQIDEAKAVLLQLMEAGWLPSLNDDMLAQAKMRRLFIATELGEGLFEQLLARNRGKVVLHNQ